MGFRGNNERTFAEYVELDIAVNDDSPNVMLTSIKDQTAKLINQLVKELGMQASPFQTKVMGKDYLFVLPIYLMLRKKHSKKQ